MEERFFGIGGGNGRGVGRRVQDSWSLGFRVRRVYYKNIARFESIQCHSERLFRGFTGMSFLSCTRPLGVARDLHLGNMGFRPLSPKP